MFEQTNRTTGGAKLKNAERQSNTHWRKHMRHPPPFPDALFPPFLSARLIPSHTHAHTLFLFSSFSRTTKTMDTESSRRYRLPTHLSMKLPQYRQYFNPPSIHSPLRDIPDPHDLFNIKEDLENIASEPETRAQRLQRDLHHLLENVKVLESTAVNEIKTPPVRPITGGKNMEVVMERIRKQQQQLLQQQQQQQQQEQQQRAAVEEDDDLFDTGYNNMRHNASRISKHQLERQAALEALKRRRRRDEQEDGSEVSGRIRKSDSSPYDLSPITRKRKIPDEQPQGSMNNSFSNGKRRQQNTSAVTNQVKKQKSATPVEDDLDFVRVKPHNQVPISTFWEAMEPYFRPLTEDDRKYLMKKEDDPSIYEVPPLGKHYLEQWAEEDKAITGADHSRWSRCSASSSSEVAAQHTPPHEGLLDRLLCALVPESADMLESDRDDDRNDDDDDDDDDGPCGTDEEHDPDEIISYYDHPEDPVFEERLKQEIQYIGLLNDHESDEHWNAFEDDEISAEIRRLGRELKEQIKVNDYRKSSLLKVVDTQLQYDQYRQVLDALEMQVEQSYMKRFRVQKAKKRKSGSTSRSALSENILAAMEKRTMFVEGLGHFFKEKNNVMPTKSIYN
ncbi:histone acetyltransferases subunit 3-domain-containing protein [Dichotomocladium elegans]|nr:histone acetyltransferases subunit 3-domain-containing protein [Dichotomocladium elegans]